MDQKEVTAEQIESEAYDPVLDDYERLYLAMLELLAEEYPGAQQ